MYIVSLHSSMDRFKVAELTEEPVPNWLYIPVWIDLKTTLNSISAIRKAPLHSSMDRFKGTLKNMQTKNLITLHSSMDRFKGKEFWH